MTNTTDTTSPQMPLGISGFTHADLHEPAVLASLYERFCEEVRANDPAFWAEWDVYRQDPDGVHAPVALSSLLTRMAPHVSMFLERLFDVGGAASAVRAATRDQDEVFRFRSISFDEGRWVCSRPATLTGRPQTIASSTA
jgi:hypothetical protein